MRINQDSRRQTIKIAIMIGRTEYSKSKWSCYIIKISRDSSYTNMCKYDFLKLEGDRTVRNLAKQGRVKFMKIIKWHKWQLELFWAQCCMFEYWKKNQIQSLQSQIKTLLTE